MTRAKMNSIGLLLMYSVAFIFEISANTIRTTLSGGLDDIRGRWILPPNEAAIVDFGGKT